MPLQDINTQGPPMQGGLLADIIRFAGQMAGKNKLRPEDASNGDPSQPPKYKADWWDSLYGGQANRINAAGGIDQYNRQATTADLNNQYKNVISANIAGIIPQAIAKAKSAIETAPYVSEADRLAADGGMGVTAKAAHGSKLTDYGANVAKNFATTAQSNFDTTKAKLENRALDESGDPYTDGLNAKYRSDAALAALANAKAQDANSSENVARQLAAQQDAFKTNQLKSNTVATAANYENTGMKTPDAARFSIASPGAQAMAAYDEAVRGKPAILPPNSTAIYNNGQRFSMDPMGNFKAGAPAFVPASAMLRAEQEQRQGIPMGQAPQQEEPISPPPAAMAAPTGIGTPSQDTALKLINFLKTISTTSAKSTPNVRTGF